MAEIVNILTFHHIGPVEDTLTIPPELFEELLRRLAKRHSFISHGDFCNHLFKGKSLPPRPLLLTFDDGYLDNYLYAFPVLKRLGIPATLFAITGLIREADRPRNAMPGHKPHKVLDKEPDPEYFINLAELRDMEESGLVTVESHTVSHFVCRNQPREKILEELNHSYDFIRAHSYPRKHYGFCWPKGRFDSIALEAIASSPYDFAFSTVDGSWQRGDDRYRIRRIDCSSWNGSRKEYLGRIRRKLFIYSLPLVSKLYSDFREYKIRKRRERKRR